MHVGDIMGLNEIKNQLLIFSNGLKIKKYKLDCKASNVKYKVYSNYPSISNDYNIDDVKNKICHQLLKYFKVIIAAFPSNYLNILYKNISTIKYQEGLDTKEMINSLWGLINGFGTTEGYYYGYKNTVYAISKKQKNFLVFLSRGEEKTYEEIINNTLTHEIFHVATYTVNDNVMFCGFYQNSHTYDIGLGINEGYTELLARRYFKKDTGYYDDEVIIATLIEEIVTKDKMEQLYFFADLKGLIIELNKYADKSSVNRFILNFDVYCQKPDDKVLEEIFAFIMEAHKNKVLKDNTITNKDVFIKAYNEKLMSYVKKTDKTKKH